MSLRVRKIISFYKVDALWSNRHRESHEVSPMTQWKPRVVMIPTLSSPVASSDDKVGIMSTFGFQCSIDLQIRYILSNKVVLARLSDHSITKIMKTHLTVLYSRQQVDPRARAGVAPPMWTRTGRHGLNKLRTCTMTHITWRITITAVLCPITSQVTAFHLKFGYKLMPFACKWATASLTHCDPETPFGDKDRVNIGSGNGLLPDGTKALPHPMLTGHSWGILAITWGRFRMKCSRYLSLLCVWKWWIKD